MTFVGIVPPPDAFVEVSGGRATDHPLGDIGWAWLYQGATPVVATVVMTKAGKRFRLFGGAEHSEVFKWEKIERPE